MVAELEAAALVDAEPAVVAADSPAADESLHRPAGEFGWQSDSARARQEMEQTRAKQDSEMTLPEQAEPELAAAVAQSAEMESAECIPRVPVPEPRPE